MLYAQLSDEVKKFVELLETNNAEERVVRYYGIAEVISNEVLKNCTKESNQTQLQLTLNRIVDMVNELTIIDRTTFGSILNKVVQYHFSLGMSKDLSKDILTYTTFLDVLGITTYFSSDDIYLINKHFTEYRNALVITLKAKGDLLKEILC